MVTFSESPEKNKEPVKYPKTPRTGKKGTEAKESDTSFESAASTSPKVLLDRLMASTVADAVVQKVLNGSNGAKNVAEDVTEAKIFKDVVVKR